MTRSHYEDDASERYDAVMVEHRSGLGELKVEIKRTLPTPNNIGLIAAYLVPDYGTLTAFIRTHAWSGEDAEYSWKIKRRGRVLTNGGSGSHGELPIAADKRIARLAEEGEWPLPHDALMFTGPGARRPAPAAAPAEAPPPPQQPAWPPRPGWADDPRYGDDPRDAPGNFDPRNDPRFSRQQRASRPEPEDDEDRPQRRQTADPVVLRLIDTIEDQRQLSAEKDERISSEMREMRSQFQQLMDRIAAPVSAALGAPPPPPEAPAQRSILDNPAITSLAALGAEMKAMREVSQSIGMVDRSELDALQRKHEAAALKTQIDTLSEKLAELLGRPAQEAAEAKKAAAAEARAAAAAAATSVASPEPEEAKTEKEETAAEALAKRTTDLGIAKVIETEDGEIDFLRSLIASAPTLQIAFQNFKNKGAEDIKAQVDLVARANKEMKEQTRLINEYAAAQERLNNAGGAMPEVEEEPESPGEEASAPVGSPSSGPSLSDMVASSEAS